MEYTDAQRYWIWLSSVQGISGKTFEKLIREYGEAQFVWEQLILAKRLLPERAYGQLRQARSQAYLDGLFERMEKEGVRAITPMDDEYPDRLRAIANPPRTLYVRGDARLSYPRMIAIVGSRKVTRDGQLFTHDAARDLARADVAVVSGLAAGADRQAHEGALDGEGITIAVLASGPEIIYPSENRDLARRILDEGGAIVSEYPPGVPPETYNFPQRNRVISGLSDGVLMTEGTARSGAMITVRFARAQQRPCFAVPGSVYSTASEGPNRMLVDGDIPALSAKEILNYFDWGGRMEQEQEEQASLALDETAQKLVDLLRFEEKSFDELAEDMKMPSSNLNSLLTILEMQGIIRQSAGKLYRAVQ